MEGEGARDGGVGRGGGKGGRYSGRRRETK